MRPDKINTISAVKRLAHQLKRELGLGFHPDDPFEDYINIQTGKSIYSPEQAKLRNMLIQQAFDTCEKENADIYLIMGRIIVRGTPFKNCFN